MDTVNRIEHHYNNNLIKWITILFLSLISLLFAFQWYSINKIVQENNLIIENQLKSLADAKTNLIDISQLPKDTVNITLSRKHIEQINSNLNALALEIYSEKNRAESIIDKDIDRLNLYMAIGIGFIAILGVFVPILVNVLTNDDLNQKQQDLKKKHDNLEINLVSKTSKIKEIEEKVEKINITEIDNAVEKSKEVDKLKEKTDDLLPKITVISLQITIHRLFNVSPLAVSKISRTNDNSLFIELFENVRKELDSCNSEVLIIKENVAMQQTLKDFSEMLLEENYKFKTFLRSRDIVSELTTLSNQIKNLADCRKEEQEDKYQNVNISFTSFIAKIGSIKDSSAI